MNMQMMRIAVVVLLVLGGWATSSLAGNLVVIASSDPAIEVGPVIDGRQSIKIAAGTRVVLISSDGTVLELTGPYDGAPEPSAPGPDSRLVDSLSRLLATEDSPGTTLAVSRHMPKRLPPDRPDLWGIDIAHAGNYCLRKDRPIVLWWAKAQSRAAVNLSSVGDDANSVEIRWPRGQHHRAWPKELELSDRATYVVRFGSEEPGGKFSTILMPYVASDAHRAVWMAEHGCTRQALGVLAAMGKGEF
jgi:hypothetical protein